VTVTTGISPEEKYRLERDACGREFGTELARLTGDIDDPVLKLKYLRGAIDQSKEGPVDLVPFAPVRRAWYRLRGLETLHRIVRSDSNASTTIVERVRMARRAARQSIGTVAAGALFLIPALFAGIVINIGEDQPVQIVDAKSSSAAVAATNVVDAPTAQEQVASLAPVAESLPQEELGMVPTTIWMADKGPGWELYSNGLRIETTYATKGKERNYVVHHRDLGPQRGAHTKPVGIIFHTSESDLWPLEEGYERELRRSSANLLKYLQREQAYNYLIDRFGRVYRVVDDETRANHAGRGIWARNEDVYLDLNSAFLGVSFESRWEGGRSLPITRAQLIAGRNLTHYLRQRFAIAPEMCVTHGLTSVNAKRKLIGYHLDWARGFPFEAFGLPNLYAQPTPSVALFGFRYDDDFLNTVGEPWPGLLAADQLLANEARERSTTIDEVRRERQSRYQKWSQQAPAADASVARESPHSPISPTIEDKRG
jgi:hypothetical protein